MNACEALCGSREAPVFPLLWQVMNGMATQESDPSRFSHVVDNMRSLAKISSPGAMGEALEVAASLLDGTRLESKGFEKGDEAASLETLWHRAELSAKHDEAGRAAEQYCERAELSPALEANEWIDWLLPSDHIVMRITLVGWTRS